MCIPTCHAKKKHDFIAYCAERSDKPFCFQFKHMNFQYKHFDNTADWQLHRTNTITTTIVLSVDVGRLVGRFRCWFFDSIAILRVWWQFETKTKHIIEKSRELFVNRLPDPYVYAQILLFICSTSPIYLHFDLKLVDRN